ncbi:MAG TPA: hypothetical protein VII48_07020 [Rhizomicrobium sp.]
MPIWFLFFVAFTGASGLGQRHHSHHNVSGCDAWDDRHNPICIRLWDLKDQQEAADQKAAFQASR